MEICHDDRRPTIRLNLSDVHRPGLLRYTRATLLHAAHLAGGSQKPDVGETSEEAGPASQKHPAHCDPSLPTSVTFPRTRSPTRRAIRVYPPWQTRMTGLSVTGRRVPPCG